MKTAVRELIDYMETHFHLTDESKEQFKVALETEKKQIIDTYLKSQIILANTIQNDYNIVIDDESIKEAEQYYSQTYKND